MSPKVRMETKHGAVLVFKDEPTGDVSISGPPLAIASVVFGASSCRRAFLRGTLLRYAGQEGALEVPEPLQGRQAQATQEETAHRAPWTDSDWLSESYQNTGS